jgi:nitroreductase
LRRTHREISGREVSPQILSNVLFAARGVNRPRGPFGATGITAASASNSQEIDVYVALQGGAYRFDARKHALVAVTTEDVRTLAYTPRQPSISPDAPVQLVFVVDIDKLEHTAGFEEPGLHDPEVQKSYYFVDTGMIAGNVYLLAASQGLACWFHNCDKARLAEELHLSKTQHALFAQTIGYPPKGHRNKS